MFPLINRLYHRLTHLLWYVHSPAIFKVNAAPSVCMQMLAIASRPSVARLHLRHVFASGRRYQISQEKNGFKLTTTSKVTWHYRRRTRASAILYGTISPLDENHSRIQLDSHISISYFVDIFLIPAFITSIVVFLPWHPITIAMISVALFTLSWIGHRTNATLEATEMIYFVQKAFQDLHTDDIRLLPESSPHVVYKPNDFVEEWEKFYESQKTQHPE